MRASRADDEDDDGDGIIDGVGVRLRSFGVEMHRWSLKEARRWGVRLLADIVRQRFVGLIRSRFEIGKYTEMGVED